MINHYENPNQKQQALKQSSRRIKASEIFGQDNEIIIEFNNQDYRLRITANDKLILNK